MDQFVEVKIIRVRIAALKSIIPLHASPKDRARSDDVVAYNSIRDAAIGISAELSRHLPREFDPVVEDHSSDRTLEFAEELRICLEQIDGVLKVWMPDVDSHGHF